MKLDNWVVLMTDVGGRPTDVRFVVCVDTSASGSSHDADGEVKLTIYR